MKLKHFLALLIAGIFACGIFTSCSDDDDDSNVSGYYVDSDHYYFCNFMNNVCYCGRIEDSRDEDDRYKEYEIRNGQYYIVGNTQSFYIANKKVYLSNGRIFTISGNELLEGNEVWTKE